MMGSESIVSRPLHFFDVPEVTSLSAGFSYNFFVSDEKINESGAEAVNGNLSSRFLRKGTVDTTNLNARIPRYVQLDFGVQDTPKSILSTRNSAIKSTRNEIKKALDEGKIYTETQAAGMDFDSYIFSNEQLQTNLENFFRRRLASFGEEEASPLELLTMLSEESEVDSDLLESLLPPSLKYDGESASPAATSNPVEAAFFEKEKRQYTVGVLNTSYSPSLLRKAAEAGNSLRLDDTTHKFCSAVNTLQPDLNEYVSNAEYLFDVPFIDMELTEDATFVAQADVVGFVFEKTRIYNGKRYPMSPVIAVGTSLRTAYDSEVAYGMTYEYSARTIAKFRIPLTDYDTGEVFIGTFLLSSRPAAVAKTTITEDRRPEPPNDINFYYNYDDDNLSVTWAPPVNPQRDVKYLQVFRRETTADPFQLLVHYDWDDSVIRAISKEAIDPSLMQVTTCMPTYYIDPKFDKTKTYIYSLAVIDARQLTSKYSTQIKVSFNESKNRIEKEFISYGGAPKQYPNWFLKENFFVDSMKDSAHSNLSIYFDPEVYTLTRGAGNDIPAFCTTSMDPLSKYVFQLINVDRLDEAQINITIDESRLENTTKSKKSQFSSEIDTS
ncbi:hypothetical protein CMI47_14605 [Candidatus Pacearchaeota archaeon]|nr:hypothetical protein [Candidatus Pacearchaeota archaeon]|tara:strand:- start:7601 stop:9424 length:1824 start_codon:yes stop_codon:yes gene_type:complete